MKTALFTLLVVLAACSNNHSAERLKKEKPGIVISSAFSYKYDLINGIYTVYFMNKPPVQIAFTLSNEEKDGIYKRLYSLDVNTSGGIMSFDDGCDMFPKTIDTLQLKTKRAVTKITIDAGCDDFSSSNASRVAAFIQHVLLLIRAKPEIKNAPQSDIHYL